VTPTQLSHKRHQ